jgi:hypothetical protein
MATITDRILVVIDASADGAVRGLKDVEGSAGKAGAASIDLGKSLKTGLVAGATALVGTGLVSFLSSSADKFVEAQRAAAQFARATNATVEEAGKFTSVARQLGLDMNDLIEINAEFSKKIEEQPELLADLNVEIAKNADGSTNMTKTLVSTIDALGEMEDGLEAAKIASELFGEEGSKQLAGFYLEGIKVEDLMDRIDFIDQSDDAKRFAASTVEMNLAMEQLQVTIGSKLVPVMTGLIDAGLAVFDFLTSIPDEVYLMVGAAAAWYAIQRVLNAELIVTSGLKVLDWLLDLSDGFLQAQGAANKAKTAFGGLAGVARNVAPFAALAAAIALVNSSIKEGERVSEFATNIDNLNMSLEDQAKALEATEGWWDRFVGTTQTKMQQITLETRQAAEASLANAEASESEKEAAQALLDVLGDGTSAQQTANLATEEGQEAARAYALSLGESAQAAKELQDTQEELSDVIAEYVRKGGEMADAQSRIASAAAEAAEAQAQQEEITRLTAEAMAIATGDAGYFLKALQDLENYGGSSVESIKSSLENIDFTDVAETWANEALIASEDAYDTIVSGLIDAVEQNPQLDLSGWLDQFRGLSPELDSVIDKILADASADSQLTAALEVARGESVGEAKTELDDLGNPIDTTLGVETTFSPDGYNALKDRKDYLADEVEATLAIDVSFGPGGYNAVKARKDYLTQDRTSYIDIVLRGVSSARSTLRSLEAEASIGSAAAGAVAPVVNNRVSVDLDGFQLRSVVREEVRFASAGIGGVA